MADRLNAATKYVVTHRPESLEWGPFEGVGPDLVEGVRRIKSQDGPGLVLSGSSTLTSTLLEHGLADEVVLIVSPVLLGTGKRLFAEGTPAQGIRARQHDGHADRRAPQHVQGRGTVEGRMTFTLAALALPLGRMPGRRRMTDVRADADCATSLRIAIPNARVTAARAVPSSDSLRAPGQKRAQRRWRSPPHR